MKDNVVDLSDFKKKKDEAPKEESTESEGFNYLITDEQLDVILYAVMKGREGNEDEEHLGEEIFAIVDWAHETLYSVVQLNQVLKGKASVSWDRETEEIKIEKFD